ncbi:threonine/serine exporter family protein [Corynebacterium diphtheriae]|uniref:threonine/serine exporter family protein n=1 Tax=Corynebacterium diphtheriae TaxID=1717 RepID=UPI003CC7EDF9
MTTTVPAAIILIPGTAMFRAVYYLNSGDMDHALSNAATAAMVVFSISAGLVLARLLTDRAWTFGHLIEFDKPLA